MNTLTVIGGGWAGLAAAVQATRLGWSVSLHEAAPELGGRARRVNHGGLPLDNGQHILLGAYQNTLQLMDWVGVDPTQVLCRLPLTLQSLHGQGLALPALPYPWNVMLGLASAKGWRWRDKARLLGQALRWQAQGFACEPHQNVAEVCQSLPPKVIQQFIEPLCESALNLPMSQASGQVFLRVMKDALSLGKGSSDLLLPKVDLGQLMPDAAHRWLQAQGATVHTHSRVTDLDGLDAQPVLLACPAWEAAKLVSPIDPAWAAQAQNLTHTAIATVYLRAAQPFHWPTPMVALTSSPETPAQFAFDKGVLHGTPDMQSVVSMVVSACTHDKATITQQVQAQAASQLGLKETTVLQTVVEKRAAFACMPEVSRPPAKVHENLWVCGDYVQGPYPATLEGAVQSGFFAAQKIIETHGRK